MTRSWRVIALVSVALAGGVALGAALSRTDPVTEAAAPADDSVEAGFARDMSTHHAQAVAMADIIRLRSEDPELVTLATDIAFTQQHQIGRFAGWLDQWGLTQTSTRPPMAWTNGHDDSGDHAMPGLVDRTDIRALETIPVADAERRFVELMVAHHQGGVVMATAARDLTDRPEVERLADAIVNSQTTELAALQDLSNRLS